MLETRYLIRFDDVCPTMNWHLWDQVESLLMEYEVKPIMGVIPDNQDTSLVNGAFDAGFWQRVRDWQSADWTIGVHGYQHRYVTASGGMLGLNPRSEFAGLSREQQSSKLEKALGIFHRERVRPEIWVAPAHSFDQATIDSLLTLGLQTASDGFSLFPYRDECGMLWIPQQLWRYPSDAARCLDNMCPSRLRAALQSRLLAAQSEKISPHDNQPAGNRRRVFRKAEILDRYRRRDGSAPRSEIQDRFQLAGHRRKNDSRVSGMLVLSRIR